jgi:hypothetical protein
LPVEISLPPVIGDPAGMRALAAGLRIDAAAIALVAAEAASTVDALAFYGPAADRIDARVATSSRAAGQLAERLMATATLLDRAAAQVEEEQRERERTLERLRRELAPAAVP